MTSHTAGHLPGPCNLKVPPLAKGLRARVGLRVDGGLRSGQDIVRAALLDADEFSFGTAAMIAAGCKMMHVCHTNSCPVGVTTQESLRAKFVGTPEGVTNCFLVLGEEVRAEPEVEEGSIA